jgi:hypothetical protein
VHAKALGFQHDSRGEREPTPLSHMALNGSSPNLEARTGARTRRAFRAEDGPEMPRYEIVHDMNAIPGLLHRITSG